MTPSIKTTYYTTTPVRPWLHHLQVARHTCPFLTTPWVYHYTHYNRYTKVWAPQFCPLIKVPLPYIKHWQGWQEIPSQQLACSSAFCSTLHSYCSMPPGSICTSHGESHILPYQWRSGMVKQQSLIVITPLKTSTLLRVPPSSTEKTLTRPSVLRLECNQAAGSKVRVTPTGFRKQAISAEEV